MMKLGFLAVFLAVAGVSFAHAGQQVKQDSLLERARKGDDSALSQMEKSGDLQDLQTLFHDPEYAGKISARLSLARMGDPEVLQYYACRSITDDVSHIGDLMRQELNLIGGDFTVVVYRHLLDSDPRYLQQIERIKEQIRDHGGDSWPRLPSVSATFELPKLFPNSPIAELKPLDIQTHPGIEEDFKSKWRTWIDTHPDQLQKLKPTAKGISFDLGHCGKDAATKSPE